MYISIDIGGTNTRVGISRDLKHVEKIERFPTPNGLQSFNATVSKIIGDAHVEAISIGAAGPIDHNRHTLISITNKKAYKNTNVNDFLPDKDVPKYLHNDTELACLGEVNFGIENPPKYVSYITISTGVGGAFTVDGKLANLRYNTEPGHHIISSGKTSESGTGLKGTLEALCGGVNFESLYNIKPQNCNDPKTWQDYAKNLAIGLHNITLLWTPEMIIIGGGIAQKASYFLTQLKESLNRSLKGFRKAPTIKISTMGDKNVLLGGLAIIKEKLIKYDNGRKLSAA